MPRVIAGGVVLAWGALGAAGQTTGLAFASLLTATPGTERFDYSAFLTGAGVLVTALTGLVVAVLGQLDRSRRRGNVEAQLLRARVEWLTVRLHAITVAAARAGVAFPPEHAPYPEDDD